MTPYFYSSCPSLKGYYKKPVLVIDPSLQFGNHAMDLLTCPTCETKGKLRSDGWFDSHRYVHGVLGGKLKLYLCMF